jgi:hypothetical protein
MLLVGGPTSDWDHWLERIPDRLRGTEVWGLRQVIRMFLQVPDSLEGASRTPNNRWGPSRVLRDRPGPVQSSPRDEFCFEFALGKGYEDLEPIQELSLGVLFFGWIVCIISIDGIFTRTIMEHQSSLLPYTLAWECV